MPDLPVLDDAFQARHLAVPMAQAFSLRVHEPIGEAKEKLQERRFDQAPVIDGEGPVGFVLTRRLNEASERPIETVMTPLGSGNVVSADASVGSLLQWIIEPGFLFVLEGRDITGFITVFDFNKQPARAYLYLLIARLETAMAELVRRQTATGVLDPLTHLNAEGRRRVRERMAGDEAAGEESDLTAYLDFGDLVSIFESDTHLGRIVRDRHRGLQPRFEGLKDLRNQVMHPVRNVVLSKGGLEILHEREHRIRRLLANVDRAIEEGIA